MKVRLFAPAATLAVALVAAAQTSAHPRTTAPPPVVNIKITITDAKISLSPKRAQRGAMGRFILLNVGRKPHVFRLGHDRHGTASQTGFTKLVKPGGQSILVLFLDYRGPVPYVASLPADRSKPGMKGIFTIF